MNVPQNMKQIPKLLLFLSSLLSSLPLLHMLPYHPLHHPIKPLQNLPEPLLHSLQIQTLAHPNEICHIELPRQLNSVLHHLSQLLHLAAALAPRSSQHHPRYNAVRQSQQLPAYIHGFTRLPLRPQHVQEPCRIKNERLYQWNKFKLK